MKYPGNSFKQRGIMKHVARKQPGIFHTEGHYYVRIEYTVWPEIYGDQLPIHFPTVQAALLFAENNCSLVKPYIRVYTPDGTLVKTFTFTN